MMAPWLTKLGIDPVRKTIHPLTWFVFNLLVSALAGLGVVLVLKWVGI